CDDSNPFTLESDGYVTNVPNLPIAVFTADCVPVLLEDRTSGVIGALHSGWRSTVADIEKKGLEKMCALGAHVSDIRIAIGPSIDRCCFEVGAEVTDAVDALIGKEAAAPLYDMKGGGKFMLDLRGVIRTRFLQLGIDPTHIEMTGSCTMCHPDRYFSHRYTHGQRGSQANMIMLP
ncbi:MAG: peptidoglycan editing factor PgeF, partial [Lachnospiraceae bacterium]|nr:peptidoglycan editing factor PgeF [Lachnospiraceae bacterium]